MAALPVLKGKDRLSSAEGATQGRSQALCHPPDARYTDCTAPFPGFLGNVHSKEF